MRTEVSADFHKAVLNGIKEGEKRLKMINKLRIAAATAALVIAAVFAANALEPMGNTALSNGINDKAVQCTSETEAVSTLQPTPTVIYEAVKSTPVPETEMYVYATERGIWYHSEPACSNMQNPRYIPISQAVNERLEPCPKCIEGTDYIEIPVEFADKVWMTEHGLYYHMEPDCSGMRNALLAERSYAEQNGKSRCPICSVKRITVPSKADVFENLEQLMPGAIECYTGLYGYDDLYIAATEWLISISCADGPLVEMSSDENGPMVSFYFGVNPDIKRRMYESLKEKRISEYEQIVFEMIEKFELERAARYNLSSVSVGIAEGEMYMLVYVFDSEEKRISAKCDVRTGEVYSLQMETLG